MDRTKPTTQMLGRFQPWHKGHTELFKVALSKTSQVAILLREQDGSEKNPFSFEERCKMIDNALKDYKGKYEIISVPNITHITYGRDVGYTIQQEKLSKDIEDISATDIRNKHSIWW